MLIANNTNSGKTFVELPFGKNGHAHFATTPANFLARARTQLLGMSTAETVPFREYVAVLRPGPVLSLDAVDGRPMRDRPRIARIVAGFRDQIQETAMRHPDQCMGFSREFLSAGVREAAAAPLPDANVHASPAIPGDGG